MKRFRSFALFLLSAVYLTALLAGWLAPASYETQFREIPSAPPSWQHPLGTDELGRDFLSRLLYGTRVTLLLAPAAALLSTILAAVLGGIAGYLGGWWERAALAGTDIFLSLPWLFLLLTVRALLPLNVSAWTSVVVTFGLLGFLGWAGAARVLCVSARTLRRSEFALQARASGLSGLRLFFVHVLPNLQPILVAQFLVSIPVFILTEANLGMLGLGVVEPLPSWGMLLRSLENLSAVAECPWRLMPVLLMVVVVGCFQVLLQKEEIPS